MPKDVQFKCGIFGKAIRSVYAQNTRECTVREEHKDVYCKSKPEERIV